MLVDQSDDDDDDDDKNDENQSLMMAGHDWSTPLLVILAAMPSQPGPAQQGLTNEIWR